MAEHQHVFSVMEPRPHDVVNMISGIRGIVETIYQNHFTELPQTVALLMITLNALTEELYARTGEVPSELEDQIREINAKYWESAQH